MAHEGFFGEPLTLSIHGNHYRPCRRSNTPNREQILPAAMGRAFDLPGDDANLLPRPLPGRR